MSAGGPAPTTVRWLLLPLLRPKKLAKAGFAFFAIKGLLWLAMPFIVVQLGL